MAGLRHLHLRKRQAAGYEPYPSRKAWIRFVDHLVLVVGVVGPVATIPQILKIYIAQDATGVSALSWGTWAFFDIPWILYGLVHRERPIMVTYTLWFTVNSIVFFGVLLYGDGLL